jgi:hypothetical protein
MTALEAFATAVGQLDEDLRRLTAFDEAGRHTALQRFVETGRRLGQSDALIRSVVGYAFDQVAGPMVSLRAEALADVDALLRGDGDHPGDRADHGSNGANGTAPRPRERPA